MIQLHHTATVIALLVSVSGAAGAQTPAGPADVDRPDFKIQVWGDLAAEFNSRVSSYVQLRSELEKGLRAPTTADGAGEIRKTERALAERIRVARATARRGDIFTPTISGAFKIALLLEMDPKTWAAVMDDNPGPFSMRINGTYPDRRPLSTVPTNILAVLPQLPDTLQYRFLGRHLVLFDTKARVVLDGIPYAIRQRKKR